MSDPVVTENVTLTLEVEDNPKYVVLVLHKKCDWIIMPWQDAFALAELIEKVIEDVRDEFVPTIYPITMLEQARIRMNHHKGLVALCVEWTDRIRFTSLDALFLVARALRKTSQDANLEQRGVHFTYDKKGMIAKIYNSKSNVTQFVR